MLGKTRGTVYYYTCVIRVPAVFFSAAHPPPEDPACAALPTRTAPTSSGAGYYQMKAFVGQESANEMMFLL
ncbi:hypothetical protein EYF80_058386 [Liparis tanakae]|uniref:Uncharacterized protein n=1 Tax=Liparis tanakae TaxID=230148 RepID=A0A4Z2ET42_9TELE|nr:hypothetical protein EYF80_058386 [Liparis tanakae]